MPSSSSMSDETLSCYPVYITCRTLHVAVGGTINIKHTQRPSTKHLALFEGRLCTFTCLSGGFTCMLQAKTSSRAGLFVCYAYQLLVIIISRLIKQFISRNSWTVQKTEFQIATNNSKALPLLACFCHPTFPCNLSYLAISELAQA